MSMIATRMLKHALLLAVLSLFALSACKDEPEHADEEPSTGDEIEAKAKEAGDDIDEATEEVGEDVDESVEEAKD